MPEITTSDGTRIYYKDWGSGQPIVFSHGWPLSSDAWDEQMFFFAARGFAVLLMIVVVMGVPRIRGTATIWIPMPPTWQRSRNRLTS